MLSRSEPFDEAYCDWGLNYRMYSGIIPWVIERIEQNPAVSPFASTIAKDDANGLVWQMALWFPHFVVSWLGIDIGSVLFLS